MSEESRSRREKQLKMRKRLLIMWAIFIPVLIVVIIFFVKNKDEVMEDIGLKDTHIYEVDADPAGEEGEREVHQRLQRDGRGA